MFSPPSSTLSMLSLDSSVHPSSSHKRKRSSDITNVSPSTSLAQQTAKDSGLIRCICGYVEDDGLTIFCDMCGFWQHMSCVLTPSPSSSSQQDNADTTTDDDEGDRSSSSARSSSSKGKSRPPVPALPEQWFCELCVPRPVDARSARARQTRRLQVDRDRELREAADVDVVGSRRRPRLEGDKRRKSSTHTAPSPTEPQKRSSKNGTTIHHRKTTTGASGSHSALSANGRRRSASVDVLLSPADEESLFEPWSNEYTRILHDFIADDAVRTSIRRWRTSLGCAAPSSYRDTASPAISPLTACAPLPSPPFSKTTSCKFRVQVKPVPPSDCLPLPLPSVSSFPPYSAPSYHDKTASSDPSYKSASYSRPPAYGLYTAPTSSSSASGTIPVGTLLTTYISHIIPVTAYTSAPLSQYSLLHLPKPHVRLIPPPLSLALDAREMGNDSRFIRNGCHPNAAIRPVLDDTSPYGVVWGVYATKDMAVKGEEIVLGWEWDRDSVVHRLSDLLEHGCEDLQDETHVKAQMSQILTTLGGTFTSCACGRQQFGGVRDCVFALMSRFVCDRSRFSANGQRVACPDDKEGNDPISSMPTPMSSPSALPTSQTLNSTLGIKTKPVKRVKNGKADLGPMVGWTVAEGPYVGIQGLSNRNGYIEPGPRSTPSSFPPTPSSPFSSTPQLPGVPTPSGSVNSKAWASVVGLYDAPRPVTTSSSSATQFRPDPSSTSSNSVLMSPTPRYQGPIYDRSNLPKISTSLPVPMASPLEPQRHQPHLPSVTNKPPSPHHGMSMSRGIVNGVSAASTCPSPILESAVEESDSYLFIVHQSPVSTSAVSFAKEVLGAPPVASPQESAEVDTLMSEGAGPLPMEQRRLAWVEDNEPIKLPPKMQKRMKSSGGGGPILEAPGTAGASSFDDKVDADATLMPPPFIPDSFDPVTVTSMPVSSPSDLHSCVELPSCSLPLSSSDQLSNLTASRKMTEMPATPNSTLRDTVVVGAPKREPEPEPEQMSTPAFTGRATTPHLAPEPLAASSPAPVPAPAVRMSFFDWKQKRAQEKHGKNRKDAIIVKEEMYECQGLQSPGLDVNVKIEADVDDGCAPLTSSSSEKMGSRTELTQPQFHIDIPTIDVSFTVASGAPMFPAPIQTPPVSRSPHEDSLPRLAFASKVIPVESSEISASWELPPSDSMDVDSKQPLECGSLWKDPATNPSPPPTLPASSEMDMDDDDVRLDVVRSPTETMRPATRPEQASLSIVLPTPSPDAEDAEDGEIPPSPHDKPLSPPTRLLATPVLPEPRRAPRSMTPLVHLPPPLPPVRRSSPGERYRPGSPPRERRLPHPSRSYRPDPPPPSLNSYRPSSPADSTSSPSDSPRHLSNTWHDEPRAPPSAGRGGDRWYGSSWRVSSSQHHSTSIGGGPRSGGPRDHYRDRDYAPPHGFARGGWDSDRGASGVGRYMDRNRYPRDRDARELIKQRGIEARAREAEVYKGRTVPSNPRGGA